MQMEVKDNSFANSRGLKIYCRRWMRSDHKHRALIIICHGYGEHCLTYEDSFIPPLVHDGWLVAAHDHVGHGRSEGERVFVSSLHEYVSDIFNHIDILLTDHPDLPVFIYGHSMGGVIAMLCGLERPWFFAGMVITGACFQRAMTTWIPLFVGRIINYIHPRYEFVSCDIKCCRDEKFVQKLIDDPLIWKGGIKIRLGVSMENAILEIDANLHKITWPIFLLHGTYDPYAKVEGTRKVYGFAPSVDKSLKVYEGFHHRIISEPGKDGELVREDIYSWLRDRLP